MTDFKLKPLIRRPSTGGETAESIFGPVEYSFDGEYDSDGYISEVQVDLPWGPTEVFTNIDDADSWAEDQILQRILSARDTTTGAMTDTRREEIARPLVWEKCDTYEFRAWSEFGVYCIDNNDGWWAFLTEECGDPFEAHADPVWTDDESAVDEMKAACKSDFECRVRRVVITPGTQPDMGNPITEQQSVKEADLERAFLAGFMASGEGWNGEYPFQDSGRNPESDIHFRAARSAALRSLAGDE